MCYYGPGSVHEDGLYWATYAVYRRIGVDSDARYERVSDIFTAIRAVERFLRGALVDGLISNSSFNCYTDTRDVGDIPMTVQAGDIIGVCVFDSDDIRMLATRLPSNVQLSQLTTSVCKLLRHWCVIYAMYCLVEITDAVMSNAMSFFGSICFSVKLPYFHNHQ